MGIHLSVSQNDSGIIIHGGQNNSFNDQVQTALADGTGTSFGAGSYFKATMSFTGAPSTSGGWPSFWGGTSPRTGNRIETDIVEWWGPSDPAPMVHYWGADGIYMMTSGNVKENLPPGFDPSQPHAYGMSWVPGTANSPGSLTFYVDGVKGANVDRLTAPYVVLHSQRIMLTLGTDSNNPLTVYSVNVWQAPGAIDSVNGVDLTVLGSQPSPPPIVTLPDSIAEQHW